MRNLFFLFCFFVLINCHEKHEEIQQITNEEDQELKNEYYKFDNIKLNNNQVILDFIYNGENYNMKFFGKEITFVYITKDFKVDENIPPFMLDSAINEAEFIISELNKSSIVNITGDKMVNEINSINVSYVLYNYINIEITEIQKYYVSIIPTKKLTNYLINLIDIYYIPIYVVKYGDTLSSICLNIYGNTNYEQILKYNHELKLHNRYLVVHPNEKIRIKK
jgi:hypothetical protein